jgi:proteasome alpha subunit
VLPAAAGYDRAITVFSPDGRLYQVEYAIETVRRGTLALGIKCKDGVVLAAEERVKKLQLHTLTQKIFQIDEHIGVAAAGYIPDARVQVDHARVMAQSNRLVYDEAADVETIAKNIADLAQQFTQYAGVRPYGVALIIGGVDKNGGSIFTTDPSGTYLAYNAVAIGAGSDQVNDLLEKVYREDMTLDEACVLAIQAIYHVSEDKTGTKHIKIAVIDNKTRKIRRLSEEEIAKYAEIARSRPLLPQ